MPAATAARSISAAKPAGVAEHHIAVAGKVARVAGAVGRRSPDDEVVEAVAIDVAGRRNRDAGLVSRILPVDDESAVAGRDSGQVDLGREAAGVAEHHIAVAGVAACVAGAVGRPQPR